MPCSRITRAVLTALLASILANPLAAQLVGSVDLATVAPGDGLYERVLGSVGEGDRGVPVAGGYDIDGDGHTDSAFAAMQADPAGRLNAGMVFLAFGDGNIGGQRNTAASSDPTILEIWGAQAQEITGSEIWMAELTGDGFGDLVICRQGFTPPGRTGAGAATIIAGSSELRSMAMAGDELDLASPPQDVTIVNIHGSHAASRLCMWARNGDVTGDGIDELVVGADCEAKIGEDSQSGAVYVFRGGSHLATSQTIDLAEFPGNAAGNIVRITPSTLDPLLIPNAPSGTSNFHFGATVQVADLDGNGRAEILAAAALRRSGGGIGPSGGCKDDNGGTSQGTLYVVWDDNLSNWIETAEFEVKSGPGSYTIIDGGVDNSSFGEEILGGRDYDDDGAVDIFVGDLTANGWQGVSNGTFSGTGHVIYDISTLKGLEFDLSNPPQGFSMATFVGPSLGAIAGDTALHGDFNGDGIDDLAFSSPNDDPFGRTNAGTLHIVLGRNGVWPALSDLKPSNFPESGVSIFEIYGAEGVGSPGAGDTLAYSAADGDMNGDGRTDLIFNEMQGDGSATADVGNLLVVDSTAVFATAEVIFADGFEDLE